METDIKNSIKCFQQQIAKLGYTDVRRKSTQHNDTTDTNFRNSNSTTATPARSVPPPRPPPPKSPSIPYAPTIINPSRPVSHNPFASDATNVNNTSSAPLSKNPFVQRTPTVNNVPMTPQSTNPFINSTPVAANVYIDPSTGNSSISGPPIVMNQSKTNLQPNRPSIRNYSASEPRQDQNQSVDSVIREFRGAFNSLSTQIRAATTSSIKHGIVYSKSSTSTPTAAVNTNSSVTPAPSSTPTEDCLKCRYFNTVDAHAANFPRHTVVSIPNLAYDLCSPFPSKTDKARAIFIWLHHNILYDTVAFFSNNVKHKTPEETLRTGLAVCQGYAELFTSLARYCSLEAIVVSGHGKGYGYRQNTNGYAPSFKSNHAWNAVQLDSGRWHLIDACWGAGAADNNNLYQKHLTTKHFTSSPETFRRRHFPTNVQHQFCPSSISWEEYIMMKDGPLLYKHFDDKCFNEVTIQPHTRIIQPGPTKFVITTKCSHTSINPRDQEVLLLEVDGVFFPFQVDSFGTTWTCENWAIRNGSQVSVSVLDTLGGKSAKGVTVQEYLGSKGRVSMSWVSLCKWDV